MGAAIVLRSTHHTRGALAGRRVGVGALGSSLARRAVSITRIATGAYAVRCGLATRARSTPVPPPPLSTWRHASNPPACSTPHLSLKLSMRTAQSPSAGWQAYTLVSVAAMHALVASGVRASLRAAPPWVPLGVWLPRLSVVSASTVAKGK